MDIQERNKKILDLYYKEETLEKIGAVFNISRSRVQQILIKKMKENIAERLGFEIRRMSNEEKRMLELAASEELREVYLARSLKRLESDRKELQEKIKQLPDYSEFRTITQYVNALGVSAGVLKTLLPDVYKNLKNKSKHKWSQYYKRCRICGTTTIKHRSYGLCKKCYVKSDYFKDVAAASRLRNGEKWKVKQKEYLKKYTKRPEIIAKYKKLHDLNNFGGNREKALIRDEYKCQKCGMSKEKSLKKFKRDLYVEHVSGKSIDLDNLITVCRGCHNKDVFNKYREKLLKK